MGWSLNADGLTSMTHGLPNHIKNNTPAVIMKLKLLLVNVGSTCDEKPLRLCFSSADALIRQTPVVAPSYIRG